MMLSAKKKTVVLFIPDLGSGGAERVFANLAGALAERGFEVVLLVGVLKDAAYLETIPRSVRICELGCLHMRFAVPGLIRYLRRERPQVLISALDHCNLAAVLAAKVARVGVRTIATLHQTISQSLLGTHSFRKRLVIRAVLMGVPLADEIVSVSRGTADDFARLAKISRERITVIYNPVIGPTMLRAAEELLDHPWFQPGQPAVVLGVGRLTAQKDFPNLLRAFARVRKAREVRLIILGEGEERSTLEQLARSLGIADQVALPGVVRNPYVYMKRASLFALSSAWEALPTVLIEAMACGCPVVSTDCMSGPREILQDGRLGRLVPPRDENALAEAILAGLSDKRSGRVSDADLLPFTHQVAGDAYASLCS